ncbi:opsin, blue-sensitive [Ceratitis capitata]|uniref:opsin, blue-sensitive n=1 Tax=Ceratitis capitata TaxID=7213 RepID=UPI00032A1DB1|nr:opsin, blue-sensitive [Ceratitis capitata]
MVTWRGEMKKSNRRRVSKRRAGNNVGNNNKALNMDDTSTITVGSGYNSNINSNSNNRNFGSQTGRAIISVATTIASTSASMAMANIPTNLLLPPSSSSSSSISTTSGSGNLMTTDIFDSHINSSNSNNNWSMDGVSWTTLNQSSATTEKVDLIEMDLANETFRLLFVPKAAILLVLIPIEPEMDLNVEENLLGTFQEWIDRSCRLYGFVGGLSGTASIGTLTAIALDRYNVVVHPLDPLRKTAKLRSAYIITIIWIYSFAFSIVPALDIGLSVYVPEGFLTTCSFDYLDKELGPRIFMFSFFIAAWCVPFGIICFSYFYILKVVFAANRIQSSKDKNKTEQKLALIVVGIIGLWFLAWTPYSIVAMMGVFGKQKYLTPLSSMIPALFCKTAACIDPYFYAATHPRFRMEFRRLWLGRGHLRRTSTTRSSYLTRSSTRRLRVISDADVRNRSSENMKKQNNLQALQEVTEENDEVYDFSIPANYSDGVEQSRF